MAPVLGADRTEALIRRVNALEDLKSVRELRPLLTVTPRPDLVRNVRLQCRTFRLCPCRLQTR